MRKLIWIAAAILLLWGGWWFAGATVLERGAASALADMAARGQRAEAAVSVGGFPNRWDMTASDIALGDTGSGTLWQAPFLQVFAMTWKPWHIIAAFPPEQALTLPDQSLAIASQDLKASLRAAPSTDLPLAEARLAATALSLTSDLGWTLALGEITVALRPEPSRGAAAYELGFDLAPITPDPAFLAALSATALPDLPAPDFPATVDSLWGTVFLTFSAPLDRHAGDTRPHLTKVEIDRLNAAWGALALTTTGMVEADGNGYAAGRITVEVTNWDRLPALLVAAGAVTPQVAPTVAGMMRALAGQSPDPSVLSLALDMKDGRMSLGPFPLGPAPLMVPPSG